MIHEFLEFLRKYGVIGLAIAVVIGGKLNAFVTSLVQDLLMPVLFQPILATAKVDRIRELNYHGVFYGRVIGSAIDFLIVAFLVFLIAKKVLREEQVAKR